MSDDGLAGHVHQQAVLGDEVRWDMHAVREAQRSVIDMSLLSAGHRQRRTPGPIGKGHLFSMFLFWRNVSLRIPAHAASSKRNECLFEGRRFYRLSRGEPCLSREVCCMSQFRPSTPPVSRFFLFLFPCSPRVGCGRDLRWRGRVLVRHVQWRNGSKASTVLCLSVAIWKKLFVLLPLWYAWLAGQTDIAGYSIAEPRPSKPSRWTLSVARLTAYWRVCEMGWLSLLLFTARLYKMPAMKVSPAPTALCVVSDAGDIRGLCVCVDSLYDGDILSWDRSKCVVCVLSYGACS